MDTAEREELLQAFYEWAPDDPSVDRASMERALLELVDGPKLVFDLIEAALESGSDDPQRDVSAVLERFCDVSEDGAVAQLRPNAQMTREFREALAETMDELAVVRAALAKVKGGPARRLLEEVCRSSGLSPLMAARAIDKYFRIFPGDFGR